MKPKICSCGKVHKKVPAKAKTNDLGTWANCPFCQSTLFWPNQKVLESMKRAA